MQFTYVEYIYCGSKQMFIKYGTYIDRVVFLYNLIKCQVKFHFCYSFMFMKTFFKNNKTFNSIFISIGWINLCIGF
jgi:hypothetical protein